MLTEKEYKRNRNGEIVRREIVEVECDKCGFHWETAYSNRKRKTLDIDLCIKCRAKFRAKKRDKHPWEYKTKKVKVRCINCGEIQFKNPSSNDTKFCSLKCRDKYNFQERYGHIEHSFTENPDEVAYLIGLIMGDGSVRKSGEHTVRIGIAFDYSGKWDWLIQLTKNILDTLQINWFEESISHNTCKMIGFTLPNNTMKKYGVFFIGGKFDAQPYPSDDICNNINYAAGLLNSDGYVRKNYYCFSNTVKSISDSFSQCLSASNVKHTVKEKTGRLDNRTNKVCRNSYITYITSKPVVDNLMEKCKIKPKTYRR